MKGITMNEELRNTAEASGNHAVDAFHDMARIWLTGAERFSALNISAARDALEDQTALARAMLGIQAPEEAGDVGNAFAQPMLEKTINYSRNAWEIFSEIQSQIAKLTMTKMPAIGGRMQVPFDWNAAFELFRTSARQFSDMAAHNMTTAADTAAAAGSSMKKTA